MIKEKNKIVKINKIFYCNNGYEVLIDIFKNLYNKKLISDIIEIKREKEFEKDKEVIAYQLLINKEFLKTKYSSINKN